MTNISLAFCPTNVVGVAGDNRIYEPVIYLRAVTTTDFMTAEPYVFDKDFILTVATRIPNEVNGIARVLWDFTPKPPGTIEFE
jgi:GMP synthase (glutamine-hydrolysing)